MTQPQETYSLAVALFDYLPVMLSGFGLAFLTRGISTCAPRWATWAWLAALLVPIGGACKASWKLGLALGYPAVDLLENMLFIAMAPGFLLMAFVLGRARHMLATSASSARPPLPIILLLFAIPWLGAAYFSFMQAETRAWFFWLLGLTTVANFWLIIEATRVSRLLKQSPIVPAVMWLAFLCAVMLGGLARLPATEWTAWIQEGTNFTIQLMLAVSFWYLGQAMTKTEFLPHTSAAKATP